MKIGSDWSIIIYDKIENTMSTAPDAIPLTDHYLHHHLSDITTLALIGECPPRSHLTVLNAPTPNIHQLKIPHILLTMSIICVLLSNSKFQILALELSSMT